MPLIQQDGLFYEPQLAAPRLVERKVLLRPDLIRPFSDTAREAIESAMILCGGNMSMAARSLGLKRTTFQSMWKKHVLASEL